MKENGLAAIAGISIFLAILITELNCNNSSLWKKCCGTSFLAGRVPEVDLHLCRLYLNSSHIYTGMLRADSSSCYISVRENVRKLYEHEVMSPGI